MDDFLDRYQVPKLNQEQVNYLNSTITPKEVEAVIKNPINKKSPGPDGFRAKVYHAFKEELYNTPQTIQQNRNRRNTT